MTNDEIRPNYIFEINYDPLNNNLIFVISI